MSRPIHSMTGFGRGSASRRNITAAVELRAVNGKFLSISCRLPEGWEALEPPLRLAVEKVIARGQVDLRLRLSGEGSRPGLRVDRRTLSRLAKELREAAREEGIEADLSAETLVLLPGVLVEDEDSRDFAEASQAAKRALKDALRKLAAMRAAEGKRLAREIGRMAGRLRALWKRARARAPAALKDAAASLRKRVEELSSGPSREEAATADAIAREVALVAQKSDVSEELARIGSHLDQMRSLLQAGGAIGRELDFIAQELFREFTTLGGKALSSELSRLAIEAKAEVSRIREQVQNVE